MTFGVLALVEVVERLAAVGDRGCLVPFERQQLRHHLAKVLSSSTISTGQCVSGRRHPFVS